MVKKFLFICLIFLGTLSSDKSYAQAPELPQITQNNTTVRFAIISDLTGGERAGGLENTDELNQQWQFFNQRIKKTNTPFYPVVGNHDISNLVMRTWWQENIAPRYYHIRHKNMLFLMLDSEDYPDERFSEMAQIRLDGIEVYKRNPALFPDTEYANLFERKYGQIRTKQTQYFQNVLKENNNAKWTFVLMHKPMWKRTDKTGFSLIEKTLQGRSYTVFNGHTHTYHYTKRFGQDYIQLGTTGGAFTPADDGEYMDHIMMVSINNQDHIPRLLNITLGGMRNKIGKIPANERRVCSGQQTCTQPSKK